MWLYFLLLWLILGLAFWIDYQRFYGWPRRWHQTFHEEGWRDAVLVSIPMALAGGPLWWVVFIFMRLTGRT